MTPVLDVQSVQPLHANPDVKLDYVQRDLPHFNRIPGNR
jgi:hypothetical protein